MEHKFFQETQISYLLGKAQKETKLVTSSNSRIEKMPDWGTQTIPTKHEISQALLSKWGDYLRVFKLLRPCTDNFNRICKKNTPILLPCENKAAWRQFLCSELALTFQIKMAEITLLNIFPAIISGPHLGVVAAWAQKSFTSVTTETNIETLAICSPVFSRKFTYELHTKIPWSNKLFWTCTMKILLHYHTSLAIIFFLYKKTMQT